MAEDRMLNDEILLGLIKANSGGGGGGTTDYEDLDNLPKINSVELKGNKSLSDLGIASAQSVTNITNGESINNFAGVETALATKQTASDNSLETDAKTIVGAINEHEGDIATLKSGLNDQTTPQLVTTVTLASGLSGEVTCVKIGQMVLVSGYCAGTMAQNDEIVQNLPAYRGGFDIQDCRYPAILDGNIVSPVMFTASTAISVVAACSSVNFFLVYVTN